MKRKVGQASRLPPFAKPTVSLFSLSCTSIRWAGETPALRWPQRGSWAQCRSQKSSRHSMKLPLSLPSPPPKAGERVAEGRERGIRSGSRSQRMRKSEKGLSMNVGRAFRLPSFVEADGRFAFPPAPKRWLGRRDACPTLLPTPCPSQEGNLDVGRWMFCPARCGSPYISRSTGARRSCSRLHCSFRSPLLGATPRCRRTRRKGTLQAPRPTETLHSRRSQETSACLDSEPREWN